MDYETPRSTMHCAATGRELQENETYWSVVYDRPEGLERLDYCEEAWQGPPADALCVWRTRVPVKEQEQKPLVDTSVMLDVFCGLQEQDDPDKINFRYILALLLMRKRILKLEDTCREDDREFLVVSCRQTESTYRVLDPHLTEDRIAGVQQQVGSILNTDV